jgi:hypothetical protein
MPALIYLAIMIIVGACVCRRFYCFNSWLHYLAASFLVGLVFSTWATYLFALAFAWASQPLLGANILFFVLAGLAIYGLRPWSALDPKILPSRPAGSAVWDAVFIGLFSLAACYLMFGTLWLEDGNVKMAFVVWNDFGPNLSLVQSFAIGHNFPTEYPHFIGYPIHYHFLFWFQAGNLEFLGLNMAWAVNLLSVFSLLAMLILIMTLGEVLFNSRTVGRIGASLFFFPTTLSYVPFLRSQGSFSRAIHAITHLRNWLSSGYPYRGEDWGIWSLGVYYVQRHFIVGTGVLLLVLIFLVLRYRAMTAKEIAGAASSDAGMPARSAPLEDSKQSALHTVSHDERHPEARDGSTALAEEPCRATVPAFIFSGALLGLLPMWNSAVFIAAFAVLALLFVFFPLRPQMLALGIAAGAIALPQLIYLSSGAARIPLKELFHWGFTLPDPTLWSVVKYLAFTFGFKWLLMAVALFFGTSLPRRVFVAVSGLILLAFLFKFSTVEILINHKFLNTWVTIVNLFCAYGLWWIWKRRLAGKLATMALAIAVSMGGIIEWFRIHNDTTVDVPFKANALSTWLQANTTPNDVFLSDRFILHPILLNGRRIFYGWPYFGWSAGYPAHDRDVHYEQMFTEKNPDKLIQLLDQNGIRFIAIDNGVRFGFLRGRLNEPVCKQYFKTVFEDKENRFGALTIYRVPDHTQNHTRSGRG